MQRLDINLARRPAENRRRIWVLWGGLLALLLAMLVGLSFRLARDYAATRSIARATAAERAQLAPLEARQASFAAWVKRPRIKRELNRIHYLNRLIAFKTISWTHLFQRLEQLMPMPVRLISIQPTEQGGHYAQVSMAVDATRARQLVRLLQRLELDNEFSHPRIIAEHREDNGDSGASTAYAMQIVARYRPQPSSAARPHNRHAGDRAVGAPHHPRARRESFHPLRYRVRLRARQASGGDHAHQ